jgi:hypothetical protein
VTFAGRESTDFHRRERGQRPKELALQTELVEAVEQVSEQGRVEGQ